MSIRMYRGVTLSAGFAVAFVGLLFPLVSFAQFLPPHGGGDELAAQGFSAVTDQNIPVSMTLSGHATSTGDVLTFTVSSSPTNGALGVFTVISATTSAITYTVTENASTSAPATVTISVTPTIQFTLRDGSYATSSTLDISSDLGSGVTYDIADPATGGTFLDSNSDTIAINAHSVLAILDFYSDGRDSTSSPSTYAISGLKYYDSFDPPSFLVNCIMIPASSSSPQCGQWQYTVNGADPGVGMDQKILGGGENVIIYFGSARQVSLSTDTVAAGTSFTATAETYDPSTNTFSPTTGVTVGVTQPNPNDAWNPLEIATSTVDGSGQAIFTLNATGTYQVGVKEDYYSPTATLTVTDAVVSPPESPAPSGNGGGGGAPAKPIFSVPLALQYLSLQQHADGSFDMPLISDWAALAFAAQDPGAAKTKLIAYEKTAMPALSSTTDYERHAMALEALGIDPYVGTSVNYIAPIVKAFDGTQIGDPSLDNDDIFALFPLTHAGYGSSDTIIQKTIAFIVSRQAANGSWDASPDITAAAVQALAPLSSLPGVPTVLTKAESYLRSQQQSNGGVGNSFATSWILQAISALGETQSNWAPSGYAPLDYLATLQQSDGGVEPVATAAQTRAWATEYAIPGALARTWNSLLSSFTPPITSNGAASVVVATSTPTTVAISTTPIATTTPAVMPATTTPSTVVAVVPTVTPPPAPHIARTVHTTRTPPTASATATTTPTLASTSAPLVAAVGTLPSSDHTNWWLLLFAAILLAGFGFSLYSHRQRNR